MSDEDLKPKRGRPRKHTPMDPALEKLLTAEDIAELEKAAEDDVLKERKAEARLAFLADAQERARQKHIPDHELKDIQIDLPGHSDRVILDGRIYLHGATYTVSKAQYDSLKDAMSNAWKHEGSVGGANHDAYQRPRGVVLRPGDDRRTTSSLIRV